jgi:hypothetical protein
MKHFIIVIIDIHEKAPSAKTSGEITQNPFQYFTERIYFPNGMAETPSVVA